MIRFVIYTILAGIFCFSFIKLAKVMLFTFQYQKTNSNTESSSGDKQNVDKVSSKGGSKGYIVLDPGHGGKESPGCTHDDIMEREITLELAFQLKEVLTQNGYTVLMTREEDKTVELEDRAKIANESGADLFISLHINAHDDTSVSGIETWFNPNTNERSSVLAEAVQKSITNITNAKDRGTYSNSTLIVIRDTLIPSCLVEVGYLSNDKDRENMTTAAYREKLSQGILDGVDQYFKYGIS